MSTTQRHQDPYAWIDHALDTIHRAHWHRSVQPFEGSPGPVIQAAGQSLINFASNDYLGLAGDDRLIQAAMAATRDWGTGATGSRLLSGHRPLHDQLEQAIAHLKQTEAAMVFSSGYLANLGAIATLVGPRDLILADQYNHASLKKGTQLSGATTVEYPHRDMVALQNQLTHQRHHYRRCLILTDSVFSMDGDLCPLPPLLDLAEAFDAMMLVDEAHATGVFGATGAGCVEFWHCGGRSLIQTGTLSKALGSLGGYVAGSASLIDLLRNRASTWIYTTGLTPAATAAALAAIAIVQAEPERRQRLWDHVHHCHQALTQRVLASRGAEAYQLLPSESPIMCLGVKDARTVLAIGEKLRAAGIFAAAVRPPTVPTSRIRISLMATHTQDHCDRLIEALLTSGLDLHSKRSLERSASL